MQQAAKKRTAPDFWQQPDPPLRMKLLAGVYGSLINLRRTLYRKNWLKRHKVSVPVVVVGNLIAGGSGKTPAVIAIVEQLKQQGWKPGVATRGYGRDNESAPIWVDAKTAVSEAGDEPLLIAMRTGVPVRADANRVNAANALIEKGCNIIVCDDGLQHYRLQRDIEIEIVDGVRRYGNGHLLPAGPLREPVERQKDCDFRVVNAGGTAQPTLQIGEWPMLLQSNQAVPVAGGYPSSLQQFRQRCVHAVAGIGYPERFFQSLREQGIDVIPHAFPDHHHYVESDFHFGNDLPILMTEKDAVKCRAFATPLMFAVPVTAQLPQAFWIAFFAKLSTVSAASTQENR